MEKTTNPEAVTYAGQDELVVYHYKIVNHSAFDLSGITFYDELPSAPSNYPNVPWPRLVYVEQTLAPCPPCNADSVSFSGSIVGTPQGSPGNWALTVEGIDLAAYGSCEFRIVVKIPKSWTSPGRDLCFENQASLTDLPPSLLPVTTVLSDWPGEYGSEDPTPVWLLEP